MLKFAQAGNKSDIVSANRFNLKLIFYSFIIKEN